MVVAWTSAAPDPDIRINVNINVDGQDVGSNNGGNNGQGSSKMVKCGIENSAPQRIVNGVDVSVARKYSWQVGLTDSKGNFNNYYCGGSIITDKHILTAAHCFCNMNYEIEIPSEFYIGIGDHNQAETSDNLPDFVDAVLAKGAKLHEDYTCNGYDNDIAVIELSKAIDLVKHADDIHPICLPKDDTKNYAGMSATVSGWGSTIGYTQPPEGIDPPAKFPHVLQEAQLTVELNSKCDISETQLCAGTEEGFENGGKDSCQGDSGGPLYVKEKEQHVQIGIVSYGTGCAQKGETGVYARVSKYLDWIEKQVGSEKTYTRTY